ncbi:MAG: triphosphoribosyl-dephospho-CoA synthase [Methylophilaceae bacterium]
MTNDDSLTLPKKLERHYKNACLAEIEALKPGNVHVFADGHGMQVQDFIKSAAVSAVAISQPGLGLGERIYQSVDATWQAVGCNTNLGIILLCAPIIQSFLQPASKSVRNQLIQVIVGTTRVDAEWLFSAIQRANPAGLGRADSHDVNEVAQCTLLEAMQSSAEKDFIALQYSNGFLTIFDEGLPQYQQALLHFKSSAWAVTELYLYWLSHYPDSHIVRKYGLETAKQVQVEALAHYDAFKKQSNPKQYFSALLTFDQTLKARGINPGTSADLTVSSILMHACVNM